MNPIDHETGVERDAGADSVLVVCCTKRWFTRGSFTNDSRTLCPATGSASAESRVDKPTASALESSDEFCTAAASVGRHGPIGSGPCVWEDGDEVCAATALPFTGAVHGVRTR